MLRKIITSLMFLAVPMMIIGLYLGFTQDNSPLEVRFSLALYTVCSLLFGLSVFEKKGWFYRLWNLVFFGIAVFGIIHEIKLL